MTALFDPLIWASLRHETAATDPHMLEDLLRDLWAQLPAQIASLQQAFGVRDFTVLRDVAHRLKGSAGMLGLPRLALAAKDLETAAIAGDLENAGIGLKALRSAGDETFSAPAVAAML